MVSNQGDIDEVLTDKAPTNEEPIGEVEVPIPPIEELEPEDQEMQARIEAAQKLLPSWFIIRMMSDSWYFGLLTVNNTIIGIQCIDGVSQAADGSIWMDVTLLDTNLLRTDVLQQDIIIAPTSRTRASINASHIVAAFELEDT
jgi:hypothetical protein